MIHLRARGTLNVNIYVKLYIFYISNGNEKGPDYGEDEDNYKDVN